MNLFARHTPAEQFSREAQKPLFAKAMKVKMHQSRVVQDAGPSIRLKQIQNRRVMEKRIADHGNTLS